MHSIVSLKVNNIFTKGKLMLSNVVHDIHVCTPLIRVSQHVYKELVLVPINVLTKSLKSSFIYGMLAS